MKRGATKAELCLPGIRFATSTNCETVCLLSNRKSKPDTHVDLTLDMEDYYRIKDQEKQSNK